MPQQVQTTTLARSLHRMFNHMQKDGYVTAEALLLLHASEKLATKLEVAQHELEGVKRALVQKKKTRERGKRLISCEEGENPADKVKVERQRKQAIQDHKLKPTRVQAGKAREKGERKAARVLAREAAKVERECEKAKRAAKKAAQQASEHARTTKQLQAASMEKKNTISPTSTSAFINTLVRTPSDHSAILALFRAYAAFFNIDLTFEDFAAELRALPGKYSPPQEELLLARTATGIALGCVAVRSVSAAGCCEMERLYTVPRARGRALVDGVVRVARDIRYVEMRVDMLPSMVGALRLYENVVQPFQLFD
ncbi:hypothetical protein LTR66_009720 [Elasticomyces elasticus]|nr:hypothetical protein LTR66_009720 [Elasticomyces elasticus]